MEPATHSNYAQMAVLSSLFPPRGQALDVVFAARADDEEFRSERLGLAQHRP